MSAEYLMKKYLESQGIDFIKIVSAGTEAHIQPPHPMTIKQLWYYDCDARKHQQRKVKKELLEQQDLIICMWKNHKEVVNDLWFDCVLFNEIAYDKSTDVSDIEEFLAPWYNEKQKSDYIIKCIDYIHDAIPYVAEKIIKRV